MKESIDPGVLLYGKAPKVAGRGFFWDQNGARPIKTAGSSSTAEYCFDRSRSRLSIRDLETETRERLQINREVKSVNGVYEMSGTLIFSWTNPDTTRAIGFVSREDRGHRAVQEVRHLATRSYWDPVHVSNSDEVIHVSFAYAGSLWIERIFPDWDPNSLEPNIQSSRILGHHRDVGRHRLLLSSGPGVATSLKVVDLPHGEVIETLFLDRKPLAAAMSVNGYGTNVISVIDDQHRLSIFAGGKLVAEYPGVEPLPTHERGSWMSCDEAGNVYVVWSEASDVQGIKAYGARVSELGGQFQVEKKYLMKGNFRPSSGAVLVGGKSNLFLGWINPGRGNEASAISCWHGPLDAGFVTWRPRPDYLIIP